MKNKGFTLIEVLAVIVILGVVMMIAVPNVSSYISKARKSTYITDAKRFVEAAREAVDGEKLKLTSKTTTYYIPRECIPISKGQQSPYGDWEAVYVVVTYNGLKHDYYFTSADSNGFGINLTYGDNLTERKLVRKKYSVDTSIGVGSRSTIKVIKSDCDVSTATVKNASRTIDEKS